MNAHHSRAVAASAMAIVALALLGGCASGPKLRSNHDPSADFSTYRTYGFFERLGTDRSGYSTIVSATLKSAVGNEMDKRGYRLSATPDLLINFQARLRRTQEVTSVPGPPPFYYGYRYGFYGPWPGYDFEPMVRDYTEGTLNIDIVDRARKQLVWEGIAIGEVSEQKLRNPAAALPEVVTRIFSQYPYAAGQGTPMSRQP
jgi:hypothetical protein